MNDYLISLFIDNELDLDEKVEFVENVHGNDNFAHEAIGLLQQEKLLRKSPIPAGAEMMYRSRFWISWPVFDKSWWTPLLGAAAAIALLVMVVYRMPSQTQFDANEDHRFVLYSPQQNQLNLVGTFTDWQPVQMKRIGSSGYWTLTLNVPKGEHRYSYVIENGKQIADPTVVSRENDDFGGENSVIVIGQKEDPVS